ncbi:MAG: SH3 domain-containing protein [Phormidesmis sp. CAN_BIN44]|nr:SH3 domain-containing protein [Phormidesmis sp. CAN_BIN44]
MNYRALLLTGAVISTVAVSSTLAAMTSQSVQKTATIQASIALTNAPIARLDAAPIADSPATPPDSNPNLSDFPHQKINLVDQSSQSPEFAQFIQQFRQAVQNRDAQFIRDRVTSKTTFDFGRHRSINYLNLDNPKSPFWSQLEKAIAPGCTDEANIALPQNPPKGTVFSCSTVFRQFDEVVKNAPANQKISVSETSIVIVGNGVNVRSEPDTKAPVIAILSDEIVTFDRDTFEKSPMQIQQTTLEPDNLDGWTPVILPNDKHGYVSNRFAYRPLGYRAIFANTDGRWMMQTFVSGD